jgi:putative tricarboxylic transport membrane protein
MGWNVMGPDGPGPGFFPIGYGVALTVLSLVLIIQRFRAGAGAASDTPFDWAGFARAGATWVAFAASAALMSTLGFYIAFALMTFFLVLFVFRKPLPSALTTGICSALGFYLVFGFALGVSMPIGLLGF